MIDAVPALIGCTSQVHGSVVRALVSYAKDGKFESFCAYNNDSVMKYHS